MMLGASCHQYDEGHRNVIATSPMWTVTAIGNLNSAGQGFGRNVVKFQASRLGEMYATGPLYDAGPHDRTFSEKYLPADWVSRDVLRLGRPHSRDARSIGVRVHNQTTTTVKWLQVRLFNQLHLVLDLAPGATLDLTAIYTEPDTLCILGEFVDGRSVKEEKEINLEDGVRQASIAIKASAIEISLRP
jgi:hypothetical protein